MSSTSPPLETGARPMPVEVRQFDILMSFAGLTTHEYANTFAVLQFCVDLLEKETDPSDTGHLIGMMQEALRKGRTLTNMMRDVQDVVDAGDAGLQAGNLAGYFVRWLRIECHEESVPVLVIHAGDMIAPACPGLASAVVRLLARYVAAERSAGTNVEINLRRDQPSAPDVLHLEVVFTARNQEADPSRSHARATSELLWTALQSLMPSVRGELITEEIQPNIRRVALAVRGM
ncbi:MAG: hypothetical protein GMKNLPBB_02194 [Myxococcota bacterium]|nr:hypothetical protein [Myxococcota bacterium]